MPNGERYVRAAVATAGAVLLTGSSLALAAARADLVAATPKARSSAAVSGGSIQVSTKITNSGKATAGPTKTAFYLSRDSKLNKADAPLGKKATSSIPKGRSRSVSLSGNVPRNVTPSSYRVLACADSAKQVRETSESNNCKSSSGLVEVIAPYDSTPFGPGSPTDVTPTLDGSASVTTRVTASSGGQVVLSRSGTTFTLSIPAGALLEDQDITMTALSNISGDPFGGFVAGVQLEPTGLTFEKPATLTVDLATPIPVAREKTWAAEDSGEDFHLYPVDIESVEPTFGIAHFSDYGVSDSSSTSSVPNPADPGAALEQQIHNILQGARERYLSGGEALTVEELEQIAALGRKFYDVVVKPLLVEAGNDAPCEKIAKKKEAIQEALSWARQVELIGVHGAMGGRIDEMYDLLAKIFAQECKFPRVWTGTMSGTFTNGNGLGLTETWTATVTFTKDEEYDTFATYTSEGSISWSLNDTDDRGCQYSGSATLGAGGFFSGGSISINPDSYGFQLTKTEAFVSVNRSCPGPPSTSGTITYTALNSGQFADTWSQPYDRGLTLSGTRTYTPGDSPDVTVELSWNLNAG